MSEHNKENILFICEEHKIFYYESLKRVRQADVYHNALCYCLGISSDTRRNIDRIYDFATGSVKTECLREGWQTSGSMRVIRMAFGLYCNHTPSVYDYEAPEEQLDECRRYTAEDLFCCSYAPTSGRRFKSVIQSIQHLHKKNAKPLDTRPRAYNGSAQVQKSKEQTAERGRISLSCRLLLTSGITGCTLTV